MQLKAAIFNIKLICGIINKLVSFYLATFVNLVFSINFFYLLPYFYQSQLVDNFSRKKLTSTNQIALNSAPIRRNASNY